MYEKVFSTPSATCFCKSVFVNKHSMLIKLYPWDQSLGKEQQTEEGGEGVELSFRPCVLTLESSEDRRFLFVVCLIILFFPFYISIPVLPPLILLPPPYPLARTCSSERV